MRHIYNWMGKVERALAIILLAVIVSVLFIAAVLRFLKHPVSWGYDIALLASAWLVFIGADVAFREGEFVDVDMVFKFFHEKVQKVLKVVNFILVFIFLVGMIYFGTRLSITTWNRSFQGIPFLSYTWATLSIPISSLCMIVTLIFKPLIEKEKE